MRFGTDMTDGPGAQSATLRQRLFGYNGGLLGLGATPRRLRRILALSGYDLRLGLPGAGDAVAIWGHGQTAHRGTAIAARQGAALIRLEDAFLRSVLPGRAGGEPPLGLMIDRRGGAHYAPDTPSDLEALLARHPLDDAGLLTRARIGMARLRAQDLSKYNAHDPALPAPVPGYVLVVDQVRGDAALTRGGFGAALPPNIFREMLVHAQADHPRARIVIKTHPESQARAGRPGHYSTADATGRVTLLDAPVSPHALLDGAVAVYTVSSQFGFEAILAGHRPHVFGMPFYAGWGLSADAAPHPRRTRRLTRVQLFAAAMILAPVWFDAHRGGLCSFEQALDQLEAGTRAWREDRHGHVALNMRLWKRGALQGFFGQHTPLRFTNDPGRARAMVCTSPGTAQAPPHALADPDSYPGPGPSGRPGLLIWASHTLPDWAAEPSDSAPPNVPVRRVEDGFWRSRGLGAQLVPPLSLVADDLGIYYDPTRPSALERLIAGPPPPGYADRAEALRRQIIAAGLSKYNLGRGAPSVAASPSHTPAPHPQPGAEFSVQSNPTSSPASPQPLRILVPGQVEDDASILLGASDVRTNLDLLRAARSAHPSAHITYKPHPDVEAGLRPGAIADPDARALADTIASHADPIALIDTCDAVWTMTSLLGFEALIRHKPVTCLGVPFYAGWGLTTDLCAVPPRRLAAPRPNLAALIHATLIAYPRYRDPVTGTPCPPEVIAARLATGTLPRAGLTLRVLAKTQGALASYSGLWRR